MNPDESAPVNPGEPPADPERLFREHNDALLSYAYARVRSWADAKDVVQEAYVRVFDLGRERPINHLRAYLYKTVHSCATDWMRRRSVREGFARLECFHVDSEVSSVEQTWLMRDEIKRAMEALPPKCRQALFLVNIRGLSYEEAAESMQIKALSVRRLVQRAIEHLYGALQTAPQQPRSEQ
ncbi:RNA polymerase sigma factor [Steroidobacter sp.]|uniref:RNA polymerase sigma factor n=1 Tax=Steroidobacter sp. TaxID=1978227 RepID=UPI001A3A1F9B|nr:RNA polymerase sigma factor [Steroidobacter sp.]MBL8270063.1 RNA polymerase sigma factor [Steroidobacter sp.]